MSEKSISVKKAAKPAKISIKSSKKVSLQNVSKKPRKPYKSRTPKKSDAKVVVIPLPTLSTENHPTLVLQTVYFLNNNCSKSLCIGYDTENDFKVTIILMTMYSYVTLSVTDWLTLMLNHTEAACWFNNASEFQQLGEFKTTNNYKISKLSNDETHFLEISNNSAHRQNNNIFLFHNEFSRCIELDSLLQTFIKQMQPNSQFLTDYYNWYVYHCSVNRKKSLDQCDYFTPFGDVSSFDSLRFFMEIPIFCEQKLKSDLSLACEE